jgi:hypothetical protein
MKASTDGGSLLEVRMNRSILAAALLCAGAVSLGMERNASAEFSLRAGADLRPLVFFGAPEPQSSGSFADKGWIGLHVAPGLRLAKIVTLELDFTPLIPVTGGVSSEFLIAPSVLLDLYVLYVRAAIPIQLTNGAGIWFEAAAGLSFLSYGYIGVLVDFDGKSNSNFFSIGAEVGFRYSM